MDASRLLTREQTDEVQDEFALRVQDYCEVSVLTLTDFFGELDVELRSFLFCHCFYLSIYNVRRGVDPLRRRATPWSKIVKTPRMRA